MRVFQVNGQLVCKKMPQITGYVIANVMLFNCYSINIAKASQNNKVHCLYATRDKSCN